MYGIFKKLFSKIKQTFLEWLLYYPGAIPHHHRGENPVIACLLSYLLSFVLCTWSSGLWLILLGVLLKVGRSESLSFYQAPGYTYRGIAHVSIVPKSVCVTSLLMVFQSRRKERKKGVWLKTPCDWPTCFPGMIKVPRLPVIWEGRTALELTGIDWSKLALRKVVQLEEQVSSKKEKVWALQKGLRYGTQQASYVHAFST